MNYSTAYTPQFKFKIALEALRGHTTADQIAQQHGLQPVQVKDWVAQLLAEGAKVFDHETKPTNGTSTPPQTHFEEVIQPVEELEEDADQDQIEASHKFFLSIIGMIDSGYSDYSETIKQHVSDITEAKYKRE